MLYVVGRVSGVTHTDDIVYVVCDGSSTIRLYNTDSQSPLNVINVDGMIDPRDIVVCRDDRQLYIAEWRCIWRVSVDDQSYMKWLTTDESFRCYSLSLTSRHLLVTSYWLPCLRQYNTTDSQLLREVSMPQDVWSLFHGVETTRGTFVVIRQCRSHADSFLRLRWHWEVNELFNFVNLISDMGQLHFDQLQLNYN